ncbi:MAG TPA: 4a-hydroxytetrahydrobiopterin dehydratase [Gammaproteobacteria bacterium]|nr:4a-hydroxytetrahydrobiopterin dehydratase [Gammaproteobacteria bacterium]
MTARDLTSKHCTPREGEPFSRKQADELLQNLHGAWAIDESGKEISRTFKFSNYYQTMAFVNAIAWIVHAEDHHPDLEVAYNRCHVRFSTHSIGGLSENDFICSARIDTLLPTDN